MTDWRRHSDSNGDLVALQARTLAVWLCRHIQLLRASEQRGVKQKGRVEKCVHTGLEQVARIELAPNAWKALILAVIRYLHYGAEGPIRTDADASLSLTRRVQSATMRLQHLK